MPVQRILVIDDSATERHYLAQMLSKHGFDVLTADSAEQGLMLARTQAPDLVLMDVVMPGLNGFQATRQLARDPETQKIPVIMCTSKSQETDRIWGLRQGAVEYVVKPVQEAELLSKIRALG
ncbi:response regulator [Tepidimonas taiwanensis]|uniref:Transcriptional regulatory protein AfsQ1 n=1 Tax=Tepidimonas taiwanensis TaxID=307486 RepID=A0A554X4U1_9BURK|nr:response regulator [Tepidimonas taiwanensis]MCX7693388.1 response regulator [Tepidimonas taiwanensis]MDM7463213.1 response regulator [Tepidimonas taiwanensis]TSE30838.1 Transcriptional regulatory protein AfsQ1 [Tepidimonas taiwanensis]UBQ06873.1 response regulator [Tepidimonas taiwanensis]